MMAHAPVADGPLPSRGGAMIDRRWASGLTVVALVLSLAALVLRTPTRSTIALLGVAAVLGVVLQARGRSARRKAEAREKALLAEAEAANRSKDEFIVTLSHELRGPLTAILTWAHLLRSGKLDEATAARAIDTIERSAKEQACLIKDLLEVSRIIVGKVRLDMHAVDLATLIQDAVDAVRPAATEKGVCVETRIGTTTGTVTGDPNRIHQVMENLLSNAIKFTPNGGRVEVRLSYVENHASIAVADSGRGIPRDLLPYVFDRFRQGKGAGAHSGGLGLGLAIVRHLVELHEGTVRVESDGEDRGANFTVTFPVDRAPHKAEPVAIGSAANRASSEESSPFALRAVAGRV
jgi:signal transduction histidine kinase